MRLSEMMKDLNNVTEPAACAKSGRRLLRLSGYLTAEDTPQSAVSGVLADLMHFCRQEGVDFNAALAVAHTDFAKETHQ